MRFFLPTFAISLAALYAPTSYSHIDLGSGVQMNLDGSLTIGALSAGQGVSVGGMAVHTDGTQTMGGVRLYGSPTIGGMNFERDRREREKREREEQEHK